MEKAWFFPCIIACAIALAGCLPEAKGPASDVTSLTDIVPVLSVDGTLDTPVTKGLQRLVTSAGSSFTKEDYLSALLCPALRGFASTTADVIEGSSYTQSYLGETITFTVAAFSGGLHGIASGVRFSGASADGNDQIVIELDPATKHFYYEQSAFIDDSAAMIGQAGVKNQVIALYTVSGSVTDSGSTIGQSAMAAYYASGSDLWLLVYPKNEFYSGKWNGTGQGTGLLLTMDPNYMKASGAFPDYPGVVTPTGIPVAIKRGEVTSYLRKYLENFSITGLYGIQLSYQRKGDPHAFYFPSAPWSDGGAMPTTVADATARLPCAEWVAQSILQYP